MDAWSFFSATPATDAAQKMMLVDAAPKGHVVAVGDCISLLPSAFEPRRTESKVWIEPPLEGELGPDYIWEAVSAFPGPKGGPRAWDTFGAKVLTSSMEMEQSRFDGCLSYRFEPPGEHIEEKAGRHSDDFLMTGPERRQTEHAGCGALVQNR